MINILWLYLPIMIAYSKKWIIDQNQICRYVLKPLPALLLSLYFKSDIYMWFLFGDIALMLDHLPNGDRFFNLGIIFFSLGHLTFIYQHFATHLLIPLSLSAHVYICHKIYQRQESIDLLMKLAYSTILNVALLTAFLTNESPDMKYIGYLLFIMSDILLIANMVNNKYLEMISINLYWSSLLFLS
jgi:hypothetical protein